MGKHNTKYDPFVDHELSVEIIDSNRIAIYTLKPKDSKWSGQLFRVMIYNGYTTVTGNYANFVFDRCFIPKKGYTLEEKSWCDHLKGMESHVFSEEKTNELIDEAISTAEEYYGDKAKEIIEELKEAKQYSHSEFDYYHYIIYSSNLYTYMDSEDIPWGKEINRDLLITFDGFERICELLPD